MSRNCGLCASSLIGDLLDDALSLDVKRGGHEDMLECEEREAEEGERVEERGERVLPPNTFAFLFEMCVEDP